MRVGQRGKDLAVRLPAAVVKALDLKPGDEVDLTIGDNGVLEIARRDYRSNQSDSQTS